MSGFASKYVQGGKKGLRTMNNAPDRSISEPNAVYNEVLKKEFGIDNRPEVVIDPKDDVLVRKPKGATTMQSAVNRFSKLPTEEEELLALEEKEYGQQEGTLAVDPKDDALKLKLKSMPTMSNKSNRFSARNEASALDSLGLQVPPDGGALKLEVKDEALRRSPVANMTTMKNSETRFPARHEETALREMVGTSEELKVNANDNTLKTRVKNGTSIGKGVERVPTRHETAIIKEMQNEEEVLKLYPNDNSMKTKSTSAVAMKPPSTNGKQSGMSSKVLPSSDKRGNKPIQRIDNENNSVGNTPKGIGKPIENPTEIKRRKNLLLNSNTNTQEQSAQPRVGRQNDINASNNIFSPPILQPPSVKGIAPKEEAFGNSNLEEEMKRLGI
jgi:hypothetical protein